MKQSKQLRGQLLEFLSRQFPPSDSRSCNNAKASAYPGGVRDKTFAFKLTEQLLNTSNRFEAEFRRNLTL